MKINTLHTAAATFQQTRRAQDKDLQNVFSEVLQNAGRQGYASAEIVADSAPANGVSIPGTDDTSSDPLGVRVQEAWQSWYQTERFGRYQSPEAPQDLGESFAGVLAKAYDEGAYVDPKSFLKGLSEEEMKVIQNAHWLADSIQVDSLTEEGALNLLIPPAAQVDLNHDGLTQSGRAFGLRFPDSTTPPEVVVAWEQATEGMSTQALMTYQLEMKLPVLTANIELDADGRFVRQREPGDPDFVNPMIQEGYSYQKVTQDWLEHLDYFKNQMDPVRYAKDVKFWSDFQAQLGESGTQ